MRTETQAPSTYVLAAHPDWQHSKVNLPLKQVALDIPSVRLCDLYQTYPDYAIDVASEQAKVASAQLVVLLHPVQWYSMPALLKLWVDEVLTHGWAYGTGASALQGKDLWLVASTGGSEASYHPEGYNRYFFDAFLPPYEQTAALCGMRFLPPMVLHGAHTVPQAEIDLHIATFAERLRSYPNWPELEDLGIGCSCEVPRADRPNASVPLPGDQ